MNALTIVLIAFSALGALDKIFGCKFGLGKEFEKAFMLMGIMSLTMTGMIVISPMIARLMEPVSGFISSYLHLDPSIIPASLFANDMGGASLSAEMALDEKVGMYNALVVSSMMGCTLSYTVPFALGVVKKELHSELFLGILCGIITIPVGCIVAGLICGIPIVALLINLLPLVLFSLIIVFGLLKFTDLCVKIFKWFGFFITAVIMLGLVFGIINFSAGKEVIKGIASIEEGTIVCLNASVVLSGALPLVYLLSKVLAKPLKAVGKKVGINEFAVVGLFSTLATSSTLFPIMDKMDKKGIVLTSAFSVSAAFTFGAHLAFTMAFDRSYLVPVIVGKLVAGILAVIIAAVIYNIKYKEKTEKERGVI